MQVKGYNSKSFEHYKRNFDLLVLQSAKKVSEYTCIKLTSDSTVTAIA